VVESERLIDLAHRSFGGKPFHRLSTSCTKSDLQVSAAGDFPNVRAAETERFNRISFDRGAFFLQCCG
jgi:hypothetical protein